MPDSLQPPRLTLRDLTPARVALATTGHSLTTAEILTFELAQARARDAVRTELNLQAFTQRLQTELEDPPPILQLKSNAPTRAAYLRQPNRGRTLHPESRALLKPEHPSDLAIILADGLSAQALERHAIPVLTHLFPLLREANWTLAPLTVVKHARVALADPIGHALQARCTLILLGERPGLTSPDSLGAYLTWSPHPTRTDADRNCLSNIHAAGLTPEQAAPRLFAYLQQARTLQLTGTTLKEGAQNLL